MEPIWESHGRQINEAGLRRGSDTSVVLTEDTDSFKIGDRVWVGGTKPGTIAYIGETKFAPGDWAGVVLDEAIGKNDGSVAGSRYFQCEPKRGIFSRLTRLTRLPLMDQMTSSITRTPTTPPEIAKGFLTKSMSPSLNASTTSLSSTVSQRTTELKMGERVIVSSSQGSKAGVLRYLGSTEFAAGEWCGVELDEPVGKNDGSVNDKRYFECPPKYGLFAPVHKVSKSPFSKRSSCQMHKPIGASLNASLKRSGSRESLASLSSITSTSTRTATSGTTRRPGMRTSTPIRSSLQEMLKEKQQEIEMLRKERDLERERITKAANQVDQAEQSAFSIKQEYDKYREEMQQAVNEAEVAVAQLISEKSALVMQLEEEKRKCEDLLFRFEEESVNKDDIQKERSEQSVINTVNESRIKELEKELSEERERVVRLERDGTKLFEAEEELARLRNEIGNAASSRSSQLQDLASRNQSLEEIKDSLEREVREKTSLVDECAGRIKGLENALQSTRQESAARDESRLRLEKELEEAVRCLREKTTLMDDMRLEFERTTSTLNEELRKSKEMIETIRRESVSEKDTLLSEYRRTIEERDRAIKVMTEELENESKRLLEQQSAVESLRAENVKRMDELSESFKQELHTRDSKIEEVSLQLDLKVSETEKLSAELSAQRELCKAKDEELISALRKLEELGAKLKSAEESNGLLVSQIQEYRSKSDDSARIIQEKQKLEQDLASLIASEETSSAQLNRLSEELKEKDKELLELRNATEVQLEEMTRRFESQIKDKIKYIDEINADVAQKTLIVAKLEKDIAALRELIANKDEQIKHLLEKTSELQYALTLSEQTKTNLESELRGFESNMQNLNQQVARAEDKISQLSSQKEKLELDIANAISSSADSSEQLSRYNEDLRRKEKELDEARERIFQGESALKSTEGKLANAEADLNKSAALTEQLRSQISDLESQVDNVRRTNADYAERMRQYQEKEGELSARVDEGERIRANLEEKTVEVSNVSEQLIKREGEIADLRGQFETLQNSHANQVSSFKKQIEDLSTELSNSRDEITNLHKSKSKLEADQSANRWSIEELTEKLNVQLERVSTLENTILEKDSRVQDVESKLSELQKINCTLATDKEAIDKNLTTSLNTMSGIKDELSGKLKDAEEMIRNKTDEILKAKEETEKLRAQMDELNAIIASMKEEKNRGSDGLRSVQEANVQQQNTIERLTEDKTALESTVNSLEARLSDTRKESCRKDKLLTEMETRLKESETAKENEMLRMRNSLECEVTAKQTELEDADKRSKDLEEMLKSSRDAVDKQKADLNDKEAAINRLKTQVKALEDAQVEKVKADQQSRNEEIKLKQNELSGANKKIHDLLHSVNTLEKQLKEQETKSANLVKTMENNEMEVNKNVQNLLEKLNVAKVEETRLLEELTRLEKENKQVTAKWTEATNQLKLSHENMKNTYDVTGDIKQHIVATNIDVAKLQEENDTVKSQIDFLNSVIVDMQRKNETLLCKIEVLEMGVPANEAEDYTRSTLDKRMAAPRMFCDICDQFDLHETEDCPRQAQDFAETIEKPPKSSKKQPVERPYCENCEMFGHDTRECDDAETF